MLTLIVGWLAAVSDCASVKTFVVKICSVDIVLGTTCYTLPSLSTQRGGRWLAGYRSVFQPEVSVSLAHVIAMKYDQGISTRDSSSMAAGYHSSLLEQSGNVGGDLLRVALHRLVVAVVLEFSVLRKHFPINWCDGDDIIHFVESQLHWNTLLVQSLDNEFDAVCVFVLPASVQVGAEVADHLQVAVHWVELVELVVFLVRAHVCWCPMTSTVRLFSWKTLFLY